MSWCARTTCDQVRLDASGWRLGLAGGRHRFRARSIVELPAIAGERSTVLEHWIEALSPSDIGSPTKPKYPPDRNPRTTRRPNRPLSLYARPVRAPAKGQRCWRGNCRFRATVDQRRSNEEVTRMLQVEPFGARTNNS